MSRLRLQLILGKFPVVRQTPSSFVLKLGGTTEMTIDRPPHADIRDGDLLTLYTEVPFRNPQGPTQ